MGSSASTPLLGLLIGLTWSPAAAQDTAAVPIPIRPALVVVQAVEGDLDRGDYESTIRFDSVDSSAVTVTSKAFVKDNAGVRRWLTVTRTALATDLRGARTQILGFDTEDPVTLPGTTALGPSLAVVAELRNAGQSHVMVRNYASRRDNAGMLRRLTPKPVPFPVLVNGQRVMVPAIHAGGLLGVPGSMRPWEFYFLDHPSHPLTLKVSYGAEASDEVGPPEWSRQIVRIDFPEESRIETALVTDCRVRVPGIYFEFDSDLINPASGLMLRWIADLLRRQRGWTVTIEGHTDSIGNPRYNQELSGRRAASLKQALATEYGIADARLQTVGLGSTRPVESNATPEGRARNRRVELVRPCGER